MSRLGMSNRALPGTQSECRKERGMNEADIRAEVKALLQVLIDLADYTKDDLIDLVDEAIEAEAD